jgi:hypothetical protein
MRSLFVLTAVTLLGVTAAPTPAQDKAGPAVEIRLKSVNDLLDYAEYVGGLVGQEEQAKQGAAVVRAFAGEKGIEGVDPKKPFGAYAKVTPNVADSPVVVMVPIADQEAFLGLLRNRLDLDPKKGDDGVYELKVKGFDQPVFFTFAKGYAYATVRDKKSIGGKTLIDPAEFFPDGDPAVVSVGFHIDRIPDDVRKMAFAYFELQLSKEKEKKEPGETPAQRRARGISIDAVAAAANAVMTGGKVLTARLLVSPKDDELVLDVTLTAADGSDLAKAVKSVASRKAVATAAAAVKNPVIAGAVNFGLSPEWTEKFGPVIDEVLKEVVESANPDAKDAAAKAVEVLAPTLKAGEAELGAAMTGPDADGHYKVVFAARVKDGKGVENLAREFAPFVTDKVKAEFDGGKAAGKPLHKFTVPNPEVKKLYGSETAWWVIDDGISILSFEPDGAEAKRVAAAAPAGGEVIRVEVSAAAAASAFEKEIKPEDLKTIIAEAFDGKPPQGRDSVRFIVTGGDKLNARLTVAGRAVKLAVAMDKARKAGQ